MDAEVKLGSGLRPRTARLRQLSEKGCGVICDLAFAVGDQTTVVFQRALTRSRALSLEGRVVSSIPLDELGDDPSEGSQISIVFCPPGAAVRDQLRFMMASHGIGAVSLRPKRTRPKRKALAPGEARPKDGEEAGDLRRDDARGVHQDRDRG